MTLNRRNFLFLLGAGTGAVALGVQGASAGMGGTWVAQAPSGGGTFTVPPLPYAYNALEPHIDAQTMKFHHDKHHATYVKNLNAALEKHPQLKGKSAEDLLREINSVPEDIRAMVRNNGGGHVNHTMFWNIMSSNGGG